MNRNLIFFGGYGSHFSDYSNLNNWNPSIIDGHKVRNFEIFDESIVITHSYGAAKLIDLSRKGFVRNLHTIIFISPCIHLPKITPELATTTVIDYISRKTKLKKLPPDALRLDDRNWQKVDEVSTGTLISRLRNFFVRSIKSRKIILIYTTKDRTLALETQKEIEEIIFAPITKKYFLDLDHHLLDTDLEKVIDIVEQKTNINKE